MRSRTFIPSPRAFAVNGIASQIISFYCDRFLRQISSHETVSGAAVLPLAQRQIDHCCGSISDASQKRRHVRLGSFADMADP
jgi:hypothetical protein